MLFSSISFLYYFLPCMLAVYFAAPQRLKNAALLLGSIVFYAWGEPKYVLLMGACVLLGYGFGLLIERYRDKALGNICLAASVTVSLSFLLYFKYWGFFLENFSAATGIAVPALQIALPIGISFYTFQLISYAADVYRGERAQKHLISFGVYIVMFPQLIAGPIVRYSPIAKQLNVRNHSLDQTAEGIRRFVIGLAKKVLLSNQLAELCSTFQNSKETSVLFCWLYGVAFAQHIYFDFSGYSDMAIGLGKIFGFQFPENFDYPYASSSITEFWRRWHISLGSWFRDYVYIPLGGNRKGRLRQLIHIFIVWGLTGFWHGASWNFIFWGLYFALLLTIEKLWLLKRLDKSRLLSHVYTLLLVMISFIIFNETDMRRAFSVIGGLFGAGRIPLVSQEALYCLKSFGTVLLAGGIGAVPGVKCFAGWLRHKPVGRKLLAAGEPALLLALLLAVTAYLVDGSFNPFLYFRF